MAYLPKREQSAGKTDGKLSVAVDPHKENGGRRKGRSMRKRPRTKRHYRINPVTKENLVTARAHNGYYDPIRQCVVYTREGDDN
jgi:hypothetical protein